MRELRDTTEAISTKVTPNEKRMMRDEARKDGRTLAGWMRLVLLREIYKDL